MNKKYSTDPIPAMKTVDRTGQEINPAIMSSLAPGAPKPIAAIIEVPVMDGCKYPNRIETKHNIGCPASYEDDGECICEKSKEPGTKVAFRHVYEVNGHNYLFTSGCCMDCIKLKHKKMLRAYLIDHGMKPGLRLWWKVQRATW